MKTSDQTRTTLWIIAAMSPLFIFLAIKLAPDGLVDVQAMHLSLTNWTVVKVGLVDRPDQPVLLIKMDNEPPGDDIAYERVVALDPGSGDMLGQIVDGYAFKLIGVTQQEVWVRDFVRKEHRLTGYALPDLEPIYDHDDLFRGLPALQQKVKNIRVDGPQADLRVEALDGFEYRVTPKSGQVEKLPLPAPPPAPSLLDGWKNCRFKYQGDLIDNRGCRPAVVDGQALTLRSVKHGQISYWHIARPGEDGKPRWEITDQQLFGDLADGDPLRYLHFATLQAGKLLLVADDGGEGDDVYVAAIDVADGRIVWTRTFW